MAILRGFPPSNQVSTGAKTKMGIGAIGVNNIVVKRKFRWHFRGYDKRGKEIMSHFVKLTARPTLESESNYLGARKWIPGNTNPSIRFLIHCVMYDDPADAQRDIDNAKFAVPNLDFGSLTLYDGCGEEIERWDFDCVEAIISSFEEIMDGGDIEVLAHYESVMYHNTVPDFQPPMN